VIRVVYTHFWSAMAPSEGGDPPPGSSTSDLQAFQALISSYAKTHRANPSRFVKKSTEIPKVVVHAPSAWPLALRLAGQRTDREVHRTLALPKIHAPLVGIELAQVDPGTNVGGLLR
jgi:hypothetical protein